MWQTRIFVILGHFLPFQHLDNPKNQIFNIEKNNHVMYGSWYMEHDRHNFLSFWTVFCPFTPYTVLYPELFWSQYTSLGSQTQTLTCSKVLISGVSFRQHSLLQSQESYVLSYSECKIAKNFQGFTPRPHWGGLQCHPRLPSCTTVFLLAKVVEKPAPPKNCWIWHCYGPRKSKFWKNEENTKKYYHFTHVYHK